jgi:hypothetical protein
MKNTFLAIFLMLGVAAQAQYKVSFVKPTVNGSKFRVTLKMHSEGAAFHLGANNLRFNYAMEDLANPVIVSERFPDAAFGETTLLGSNAKTGIVSVNTAYKGVRKGKKLQINRKGAELVTLEFDILKNAENTPLKMRIEGAQPRTTVLMDDARSIVKLEQAEMLEVSLKNAAVTSKMTTHETVEFRAAPNPTSGAVNVVFDAVQSGNVAITLTDLYGRIIKTQNTAATAGMNQTTFDLSELPSGAYFISLQEDTMKHTQRIVKQ